MTMILIFVILYVAASVWDVGHVNDLLAKTVNPDLRLKAKSGPAPAPAPRLVINPPSPRP